jgi:hypothetical protein
MEFIMTISTQPTFQEEKSAWAAVSYVSTERTNDEVNHFAERVSLNTFITDYNTIQHRVIDLLHIMHIKPPSI